MDTIYFQRHQGRNSLFRMILLAIAVAALIIWKIDYINSVYFRDQLTATGWIVNGAIIALFSLGILKIILTFISYSREEAALNRFIKNMDSNADDTLKGVSKKSIIARRYLTLEKLHETHTPVNQSALASTLVASESTRNSFPRFINNTLILTGVFGTIVSLSLALIGASDMLENAINVNGMGMIVHGMSTALSTTITAIACYMFFGYFFVKLTDVQTNLISAIEQVTATHLMPRFQMQTDNVLYEFTGLIRSLQGLVSQMVQSQSSFQNAEKELTASAEVFREHVAGMNQELADIKGILRIGFRLGEK
ncbi:MAG: hypothetical protein HKP55_08025 [Gammaproteobacteria bacterium]|nr:hypothetical protein [Gammaproteobacteria bacterium]